METLRRWTARLLLGFVLITIGFSIGRRSAPGGASVGDAGIPGAVPPQFHHVAVVAAHMTFRCPECNQIEWFARELIESEFAQQLADGRLSFRTVDYMRDTEFARRYNIASSTIVVSRIVDGEERGYHRLDEVWTKLRDRDEFFAYLRGVIRESLSEGDEA